jgi:hypothetical protein
VPVLRSLADGGFQGPALGDLGYRGERMIEDMILDGLALGTRQACTQAVRRLAVRYRRSPDQLSEKEVRGYLLESRQQGVAGGSDPFGNPQPVAGRRLSIAAKCDASSNRNASFATCSSAVKS